MFINQQHIVYFLLIFTMLLPLFQIHHSCCAVNGITLSDNNDQEADVDYSPNVEFNYYDAAREEADAQAKVSQTDFSHMRLAVPRTENAALDMTQNSVIDSETIENAAKNLLNTLNGEPRSYEEQAYKLDGAAKGTHDTVEHIMGLIKRVRGHAVEIVKELSEMEMDFVGSQGGKHDNAANKGHSAERTGMEGAGCKSGANNCGGNGNSNSNSYRCNANPNAVNCGHNFDRNVEGNIDYSNALAARILNEYLNNNNLDNMNSNNNNNNADNNNNNNNNNKESGDNNNADSKRPFSSVTNNTSSSLFSANNKADNTKHLLINEYAAPLETGGDYVRTQDDYKAQAQNAAHYWKNQIEECKRLLDQTLLQPTNAHQTFEQDAAIDQPQVLAPNVQAKRTESNDGNADEPAAETGEAAFLERIFGSWDKSKNKSNGNSKTNEKPKDSHVNDKEKAKAKEGITMKLKSKRDKGENKIMGIYDMLRTVRLEQ